MPASKEKALDPLKDLLGDVLSRLEALEQAAGVAPPPAASAAAAAPAAGATGKACVRAKV